MRMSKSVNNGSNGDSVSGITVGGLARAGKDSVKGKIVGSSELATNVNLISGTECLRLVDKLRCLNPYHKKITFLIMSETERVQ